MGKPSSRRRARRVEHRRIMRRTVSEPISINCAVWNCNGLIRDNKQDMIVEVMEDNNIHVLSVSETHLRQGSNDDLACLDKFTWYSKERLGKEKKGGGILTIIRPGLNHSRYEPPLPMHPYLDNEREWILIHENDSKVAICFVYLAAEVGGNNFQVWNAELCAMLQAEVTTLREDGYTCSLAGDFNGHIGADSQGIPGNNPDINSNGRLIRNFVASNGLRIVNGDTNRCEGLFTRLTANSVSALDLVLEDDVEDKLVVAMSIDTYGRILGGSDHSAVFFKMKINQGPVDMGPQEEPPVIGPTMRTADAYREAFEALVVLADWGPMDTGEKCIHLQETLVGAARLACNQNPHTRNSVTLCKSMRKLRKKCIVAESQVRQLEYERTLQGFGTGEDGKRKEELLSFFRTEAKTLRLQITDKIRQRHLRRRLHASSTISSKQFWRLVRRTVKKKGVLSAVKDGHGRLATDRARIEEIVLEELAKIFSGQRSAVFSHRGQQLIKEMDVKQLLGWQEWMRDSVYSNAHEEKVCSRTSEAEVKSVIDKMKLQRAPGVDNVTVAMLKYAGPGFISLLTELVNNIFLEGQVPEALLVGRMTLIDKKSTSLLVSQKRPLTVSCVILSVITKIMHGRMDKICEENGYYGKVQYGFRSGRSTSDCVFMLLAAVRKAKRKGHTVTIAFCDIAKAYDSVNRELLYTKLDTIGFGGRVKSLIQSMYYNDSVRVRIKGGLTAPLWFTKGVKQGCVLSPLLFSLYMAGLGERLHAMKEGVNFNGQVISALFFADDLVLISRTRVRGMERMLKEVSRFCKGVYMKLSIEKTVILSNGQVGQVWKVELGTPDLEATLAGKYLGVDIQVKGRNLVKPREERMLQIAQKYANTIMGVTRAGLDRALVAHTLWERCAIPAVLYAVEAMLVTDGVVDKLDSIQHQVARFILQLPRSTAKVAGYMDAGFKPIKDRIRERVALYVWGILHKKCDPILNQVFDAATAAHDPWARMVGDLVSELGFEAFNGPKSRLKKRLTEVAIQGVLRQKKRFVSLNCLPNPQIWFKLQPHVCDSKAGGLLNRIRAGDAGLGNRRPNIHGSTTKWCPLCLNKGLVSHLSEAHVVVSCQAVAYERSASGLGVLMTNSTRSDTTVLTRILGGDNASREVLLKRADKLSLLLGRWMELAGAL